MAFTQRNQWVTVDVSSLGYDLLNGYGSLPWTVNDKGPLPESVMVAIENLLVSRELIPSRIPKPARRKRWRFDPTIGAVQVAQPIP